MFERKRICNRLNSIFFDKYGDFYHQNETKTMYKLGITDEEIDLLEQSKYAEELVKILTNRDFMKNVSKETRILIIEALNKSENGRKASIIGEIATNKNFLANKSIPECDLSLLIDSILKISDNDDLYNCNVIDNIRSLINNSKKIDAKLISVIETICNSKGIKQAEFCSKYANENYDFRDSLNIMSLIANCENDKNVYYLCCVANYLCSLDNIDKIDYMEILKLFANTKNDENLTFALDVVYDCSAVDSKYYKELIELVINAKGREQAELVSDVACDCDAINSAYILDFLKIIGQTEDYIQAELASELAVSPIVLEKKEAKEIIEIACKNKNSWFSSDWDLSSIFNETKYIYKHPFIVEIFKIICETKSNVIKKCEYDIVMGNDYKGVLKTGNKLLREVELISKCENENIAEYASKLAVDDSIEKNDNMDYKYMKRICSCKNKYQAHIMNSLIRNDDFRQSKNHLRLLDVIVDTDKVENCCMLQECFSNKDFLDNPKNVELANIISNNTNVANGIELGIVATSKDVLDSVSPIRLTKMASEGISSKNVIGLAKIMEAYRKPKYEPKTIKRIKKNK